MSSVAVKKFFLDNMTGDGKVFVLPVEKVYRIRTGEEDRSAVTPVVGAESDF